ncbi:tRNA 2-selenouridine(34) synthase MnmH [Shewanella sp. 10N.7]|uniref:tRNA 2-selenouridine(34) synthase MnmH n=1 Tax=Shewanella sp. 10N.7 TaxID=2885093 RepID=UPI001E36B99F|nr:tRNA 2-selenouridine(34) synthase MnmH [Shewanella sp. 10N.7]MCC4833331.1 tRNA 2-selenouridine(34) synthase MnmH [Shewanella sp. 10N.7]
MAVNMIADSEYQRIFIKDVPLLDVRAPVEFIKGAFGRSTNIGLMTDDERKQVGTWYKLHGQDAAIALGHSLVNGNTKQQRIEAWQQYIATHPNAYLYCFRGGLRSKLSQQWIKEAGIDIPYIEGGYKAMRQYLIKTIEQASTEQPLLILSGITGSGKTDLLLQRHEAIDLEGLANHRGSSFGKNIDPQPTQINFENNLAIKLLKQQHIASTFTLLEDESYLIGRSAIPQVFYQAMQRSPIIVLEESFQNRLNRLHKAYVADKSAAYINRFGAEAGQHAFSEYLLNSINSIKKRLGGQQHAELTTLIEQAINSQFNRNDLSAHFDWITSLLRHYYDPMYQYQLSKKQQRVIFSGDHQAIHDWLSSKGHSNISLSR